MANDCIPLFRPGADLTAEASAAVTGKRCVRVSAAPTSGPLLAATADGSNIKVAHCDGTSQIPFGISKYDAAINGKVGVIREGVVPITSGAAVTAGQQVMADANGKVVPYVYAGAAVPIVVGTAITTVGGADLDVYIALKLA
jgi:hypothetical protein